MGKLLKFEWRKLWRQKSLYIIFSIGFISIILSMLLAKLVSEVAAIFNPSDDTLNATKAMLSVLVSSSNFISLLGIYIAIFVCSDYSQHTIKNIYARGYNRSAVYFSKYLISLFVSVVVAIIYIAFGFLFVLISGGYAGSMPADMWRDLVLQLWTVVGIHGLFFGISMMVGNVAGSLAFNLVGVSVVFALLNTFFQVIKVDFDVMRYSLEMILGGLARMPISYNAVIEHPGLVRALIVPLAYVIVFVGGGWLVNRRRDV
jgi:ABC-type transport system involved in multi-copper enzyme maturation permease subunit